MDAKNNESAERDFAYFDEMFDFEVYFKDSENEDQNYFSSSGTESESAGTQMSEQNPRHTETLLPASITEQNDLLSRNTPPLPEYSENDIPIWNDHELAWTTPIPWTPVQVMLMEPRETQCQYSDEVLGLNVFQRSTATQGANNHVHKAYSALSLESQSRETTERFVLPTHRDLEWNGQDNQNKPHKNPQGPNLAITDLFGTYPTESVDPPNSWPAVPINEFYISENNVDASISKTENHNEFGPSSTTSNVYQNSFTWNKEDSFSSTGASEDTISPCFENRYFSHLQTAIPAERQESLIPRSHLLDEAAAKPVCHRAFPSKMRSADIQATDVPGMNYGIRTHMTCRQVDSKFSVTFNPPGFQVSENTNVKHSGLHQRVLAPAVQLQAISFPVGRHHPVGIIISQPTYQDHVLTFESKSGASKKLSTRSCYDTEQRLRVAETRKKGACVTCQARKVACIAVPGTDACENCIKKAGEAITSHNICVRQQLEGIRFGIEDFYYRASRSRTLLDYDRYYEVYKPSATKSTINISHAPKFGTQKLLHVEVQKYPGNDIANKFFKVGRVGGPNCSLYTTEHYMIVNSSLPSVDQLDAWGRELVHAKCALDPHALQSAIDTLLIRYCSVNRNPRIAKILDSTLRIVSLNACRGRPAVNFEESMNRLNDLSGNWSDNERQRGVDVSDEVHAQLVFIALTGIEDAEKSVLGSLDRLRKEMKIGRLEWIAVGVCLMRLLLVYRDVALRYVYGAKQIGSNIDSRMKRAMLMYDTLTAVYGATFHKTISPLSGQWRTEDHREALCNDPILMGAMESLKFQYIRVCMGAEFEPEDNLFKELIAIPMMQQEHQRRKKSTK